VVPRLADFGGLLRPRQPKTETTAAADGERTARRLAYAIAPGILLAGVAGGIAFPVLPLVGLRAGLPLWLIGTILAANRAGRVLSAPFVGALTDRLGGRRMLVAGLALQVAVMALYLLGVTLERPGLYFLLARVLHGPASACVFVAAQTLALHAGGRSYGGLAAGTVRAAMSAGMPIGLAVGGLLAALWGEREMFEAAMVAVGLGALVAFLTVPDLRAAATPEGRPPRHFRPWANRRLLAIGALNFASFFAAQGVVLTTLGLLLNARGLVFARLGDVGTSGLAMAWMVLVSSATMAVAGRHGDQHGSHARIAAAGIVLTIPGLLVVAFAGSVGSIAAGVGLVGLGMGALGPSVLALLSAVVEPEDRGRATGILQLFADIGGVGGPILGTTLIAYGQAAPYLAGALVLVLVLPVASWMARLEMRAGAESIESRPLHPHLE
jgi:MFS family permease